MLLFLYNILLLLYFKRGWSISYSLWIFSNWVCDLKICTLQIRLVVVVSFLNRQLICLSSKNQICILKNESTTTDWSCKVPIFKSQTNFFIFLVSFFNRSSRQEVQITVMTKTAISAWSAIVPSRFKNDFNATCGCCHVQIFKSQTHFFIIVVSFYNRTSGE